MDTKRAKTRWIVDIYKNKYKKENKDKIVYAYDTKNNKSWIIELDKKPKEKSERAKYMAYRRTLTKEERDNIDKERNKKYFAEYYKKNKDKINKRNKKNYMNRSEEEIVNDRKYQREYRIKKRIEQWKTWVFKPMTEEEKKQKEKERYIKLRDAWILRERKNKRYKTHKDLAMKNNKKYIDKHPEKKKEWRRNYYIRHREEIKEKRRLAYANRDKDKE